MMKKTLIMASVLMFASASMCFADEAKIPCNCGKTPCDCAQKAPECKKPPKGPDFAKRHAEFEKRLKLTDEQKAKAEAIRKDGFEKIKPIMEKLKEKRLEVDAVKRSKLAPQAQQEKLDQLHKEIKALKRAAHELRMQNMKEFEGILTKKQLKELKKMKEEGRKKFEKEHKKNGHPQFGPRPEGPRPEGPCPPPAPAPEPADK